MSHFSGWLDESKAVADRSQEGYVENVDFRVRKTSLCDTLSPLPRNDEMRVMSLLQCDYKGPAMFKPAEALQVKELLETWNASASVDHGACSLDYTVADLLTSAIAILGNVGASQPFVSPAVLEELRLTTGYGQVIMIDSKVTGLSKPRMRFGGLTHSFLELVYLGKVVPGLGVIASSQNTVSTVRALEQAHHFIGFTGTLPQDAGERGLFKNLVRTAFDSALHQYVIPSFKESQRLENPPQSVADATIRDDHVVQWATSNSNQDRCLLLVAENLEQVRHFQTLLTRSFNGRLEFYTGDETSERMSQVTRY